LDALAGYFAFKIGDRSWRAFNTDDTANHGCFLPSSHPNAIAILKWLPSMSKATRELNNLEPDIWKSKPIGINILFQCVGAKQIAPTRRLRDLVRLGNLDFTFVPCACPPGTQGTRACNFGRRCGTLKVQGRDVADILISEGLAAPFVCEATRCPRMPSPWCSWN
jgi:hypothetical protein